MSLRVAAGGLLCLVLAGVDARAATEAGAAQASGCRVSARDGCYFAFEPGQAGGRVHFYASMAPGPQAPQLRPSAALIALHGHSHDANTTFDAALGAVRDAQALDTTLVVAPLFQVDDRRAPQCRTAGVPAAQAQDLVWSCGSWSEGAGANDGAGPNSFEVMDALVAELLRRWPSLRQITIAGFSAGAQMVQRYVGFAADPPSADVALRFVVSDPGSWLYFDPVRPRPERDGAAADWDGCGSPGGSAPDCTLAFAPAAVATCPGVDRWKYGTSAVPASLRRDAAAARQRYAQADVGYLEGALDAGAGPGTAYRLLDRSCAAIAQGPDRLRRGLAYAQYDRQVLAPARPHPLAVVPGCAHSVTCVFAAPAARAALLGSPAATRGP